MWRCYSLHGFRSLQHGCILLGLLQAVEEAWGSVQSLVQVESLRGQGRSGYPGYTFLISCLSFLVWAAVFLYLFLSSGAFLLYFVVLLFGYGCPLQFCFLQTGLGISYSYLLPSLWAFLEYFS